MFETLPTLMRYIAKDGLGVELPTGQEPLREDARSRAACDSLSQWLEGDIENKLKQTYNFEALNAYIASLEPAHAPLVSKVQQTKEVKGNQDAKKRKAPAQGSRGTDKLKKANTTGMANIATFFQKKPAK
jgi:ribonuclease H2 subunit B